MNHLSKDILEKIKKGQVELRPKWYFRALRTAIWSAVIFVSIFAALSSAIVIRHVLSTDWELARSISDNSIISTLSLLPYLWIGVITLLILASDLLFRNTNKGYRYRTTSVIMASVIISLAIGTGLFAADADQPFEAVIRKNIKPYEQWETKRQVKFVAPEKGGIAGEVESADKEIIRIRDFRGNSWDIDTKETKYTRGRLPEKGERIGVMGEKTQEGAFKAKRIRSWNGFKKHSASLEHRSQNQ